MTQLRPALVCLIVIAFVFVLPSNGQVQPDQEKIWSDFANWLKTQPIVSV